MKNKLTMIVSTCDKFSDIWETQVYLLNKNWPDRDLKTLMVTDKTTDKKFKNVTLYSGGENSEFSERLMNSLNEVSTEYVLIILDDYFITKPISSHKIKRLIQAMENEQLDYVRMYPTPKSETKRLEGYKDIYLLDTNKNYSVNLYPGIWRVSFLKKTFKKPMSAWEYEVSLSRIANETNANCVVSKDNEFPFLNGIIKGKFFRKAKKYIVRNNLYNGDRSVLSLEETIKYNFKLFSSQILPGKLKRKIKNVLRRYGYTFYSD